MAKRKKKPEPVRRRNLGGFYLDPDAEVRQEEFDLPNFYPEDYRVREPEKPEPNPDDYRPEDYTETKRDIRGLTSADEMLRGKDGALIGAAGASGDTSDNDEAALADAIKAAGLVPDAG